MEISKIKKYIKGIGITYGIYGFLYKFNDTTTNLARLKFGKEKFLKRKLNFLIKKYKNPKKYKKLRINSAKTTLNKFPIWFCWFQGLNNAPEIVRICYNSLTSNISNKQEIHVITMENLNEYIKVPTHIRKKIEKGTISLTLFSDFVRVALLSKFGGFWIDATILVTSNIEELCNYEYYTKKSDRIENNFGNYLVEGRFTIHLFKCSNTNLLVNFLYDALVFYYKKYDMPVDYYMTNLLVDLAYNYIPEIKKDMNKLSINDRGLEGRLGELLNCEYNEEIYKIFINNMPFQKLSYRNKLLKEKIDNKLTFYGYIKNKYLQGEKNE